MASNFTNGSQRFLDVDDEPQKMLPPLRGFEGVPLVTLEEAAKPLIKQVPDIEHMVLNAKRNQGKIKHGLTVDESASITLYSDQWTVDDDSFYSILNKTLRSANRSAILPAWFLYLKLLITALDKLPPVAGETICRGVKQHFQNQFREGDKFVWWGFSSCTSSVGVQKRFLGKSGPRTLFFIRTDNGKSIKAFRSEERRVGKEC